MQVARYASHQVEDPPPCRTAACRRWLATRPPDGATERGLLPERFLVDPYTSVPVRVAWLNRLARQGATVDRARLIDFARLARQRGGNDPRAVAQELLAIGTRLVAYVPDPGRDEVFQGALYTLLRGAGDCEDKAVFFGSLGLLAGLSAEVCWIDQPGASNNHVAPRVCLSLLGGVSTPYRPAPWDDDGQDRVRVTAPETMPGAPGCEAWHWAETTLRGARVGEHPYAALRRLSSENPRRTHL